MINITAKLDLPIPGDTHTHTHTNHPPEALERAVKTLRVWVIMVASGGWTALEINTSAMGGRGAS